MLSRLMVGAQTSVSVGLIAVSIGLVLGVALGAWAAARRGWVDEILSRFSDLVFAIPALLLAILITVVFGANVVIYLQPGLAIWPGVAIALSVMGLNLAGHGRRDPLDPRLRLQRVG